jgi:hypothetical protein
VTTVVDRDVEEHRAEISRQNHTTAMIVVVALAVAVAAFLFTGSEDPEPPIAPSTVPTTVSDPTAATGATGEQPETVEAPPVVVVATGNGDVFVTGSTTSPLVPIRPAGVVGTVTHAVVTGDRIAVLDDEGRLAVGRQDGDFRALRCCDRAIVASNEPAHVWALDGQGRALLVDLDRGPTGIEVALDGQQVIGLGPSGLVTVDADLRAHWRRPGFEPTPVPAPDGRRAIASGGDVVAFASPETDVLEIRRIADGALVRTFAVSSPPPPDIGVVLSTAGDAVAITQRGTAVVFRIADGERTGTVPARRRAPVPVGAGRFAGITRSAVVGSDDRRLVLTARPQLIAVRAE